MGSDKQRAFAGGGERNACCEPRADCDARRRADRHDAFLRAFAQDAHFAVRDVHAIDIESREALIGNIAAGFETRILRVTR